MVLALYSEPQALFFFYQAFTEMNLKNLSSTPHVMLKLTGCINRMHYMTVTKAPAII
jgi:hypothetical protein